MPAPLCSVRSWAPIGLERTRAHKARFFPCEAAGQREAQASIQCRREAGPKRSIAGFPFFKCNAARRNVNYAGHPSLALNIQVGLAQFKELLQTSGVRWTSFMPSHHVSLRGRGPVGEGGLSSDSSRATRARPCS